MKTYGSVEFVRKVVHKEIVDFPAVFGRLSPVGFDVTVHQECGLFFATMTDRHDKHVVVQSLRHCDPVDALLELEGRYLDLKMQLRAQAWSKTPLVDSLAAIGA